MRQEPIVSGVVADDRTRMLPPNDELHCQQVEQRKKPELAEHDGADLT